jgi:hypothetical protein
MRTPARCGSAITRQSAGPPRIDDFSLNFANECNENAKARRGVWTGRAHFFTQRDLQANIGHADANVKSTIFG